MPCLIVKLEAFANGDVTIEQVIDKIMEDTAATERPFVKKEKDAVGKLHKAIICFAKGTISKADLKKARDIAIGKADVTFGVQFPLDFSDDLEALTPAAIITDDKLVGNPANTEIPLIRSGVDNSGAGWRVSADGKGEGGSGNALELKDLDTSSSLTGHRMVQNYKMSASDIPAISLINSWVGQLNFLRNYTYAIPGDQPDRGQKTSISIVSSSFKNGKVGITGREGSNYEFSYSDALGTVIFEDTGVGDSDGVYIKIKITVNLDGTWTFDLNNGAYTKTVDLGFNTPTSNIDVRFSIDDTFVVARTVTQEPVFVDNITFQVNDGVLAGP